VNAEILQGLQFSAPMLVIAGLAIAVMLIDAFAPAGRRDFLGWVSILGIVASMGVSIAYWGEAGQPVGRLLFSGMFVVDNFSLFFNIIFCACAIITILFSMPYLEKHKFAHGEYYALVLFALCGMMVMGAAGDMLSLFVGLETMSLSTYVLVGFRRGSDRSAEGSMKYFLLGALATAILLYGVALLYGATGSTSFQGIAKAIQTKANLLSDPYLVVGFLLVLVAFAFKVGSVPFHMWAPDAYEGAPTSVAAFMACAVKAAAFAALIRLFATVFAAKGLAVGPHGWFKLMTVLCILTMVVGNLVAIAQKSAKRMLAYSSIGHAGYLLLGLLAVAQSGNAAASTVLFYLFAYSFTVLGAFGVVLMLEREGRDEPLRIADFAGLGARHPYVALAMTIFLLSLAGVPPTAGFFAKFYLFRAGIEAGAAGATMLYTLVVLALLTSAAAAFYYLRVVVYMYFRDAEGEAPILKSGAVTLALVIAVVAVIVIGVLPDPYLSLGQKAMSSLSLFGSL
jgi:NADH-quinone oxidoreductase subunit N